MFGRAPMKLFSCRSSNQLAQKIADELKIELGKSSVTEFSDGEFQPCYDESVRGCMVFIVQSTNPPADNLFELLLMIDAAKRASAYKVIAVIPYYGFARQDRKDRPRVSIGSKLSADILSTAGVDRIITMDLHADVSLMSLWITFLDLQYLPHILRSSILVILQYLPQIWVVQKERMLMPGISSLRWYCAIS
jgi:ribose-phosphate pyrophosphokinase